MNKDFINNKVGIITYHRAINYGAILQTYALQTKIRELGAQCEVIDYRNPKLEDRYKKRESVNVKMLKI